MEPQRELATLAGGCFWCLEAVYDELRGVHAVESGYAGGSVPNPTYSQICSGRTGHAEVVQIAFDPQVISYRDLLDVFFTIHDPTTLNRQGHDVGTQYRSAIYYHSPDQQQTAETAIQELGSRQAVGQSRCDRSEAAGRVLLGGGVPPGVLHAQPGTGVLPGGDCAQGGESAH